MSATTIWTLALVASMGINGPKHLDDEPSVSSEPSYSHTISVSTNFYKADDDTKTLYTLEDKDENPIYELSADGWTADDDAPIVLTIRETFAPLEMKDKMVYAYIYKVASVNWAGEALVHIDGYDYSYELAKPATEGAYNLSIVFAKTLMSYKDVTNIDWSSLLTAQNLMVVISWALLFAFSVVMLISNRKLKNNQQYTLAGVKKVLISYIDEKLGAEFSKKVEELFDNTIKATYGAIDKKLNGVNDTVASMARCMMLLADGTPDARVALLKELSTIQSKDEELAKRITAMIEEKVAEERNNVEAKEKALAEAKAVTEKYTQVTNEKEAEDEEPTDVPVRPVE